MPAYSGLNKLPADWRAMQRTCVRRHNRYVFVLMFCTFGPAILILYFFSFVRVFGFFAGRVAVPVALVLMVATLIAGAVLIQRADARFSRRIGFVCPSCGQPLYAASSVFGSYSRLVTRGECPHCHRAPDSSTAPRA